VSFRWAAPGRWAAAVLAAGKGKRMGSDLPKVLHRAGGAPLLGHVLETARRLAPPRLFVIVGHGRDDVVASIEGGDIVWVDQTEQRGTGDAVSRLEPTLGGWEGDLLILYGDVPLLRPWTLADLVETHGVHGHAATILTSDLDDPTGYGRILRDRDGRFTGIREQSDLEPGEDAIREINSGIGVFRSPLLFRALEEISPDNAQGEYYLTDVIARLRDAGQTVGTVPLADPGEIEGVNSPADLGKIGRILRRRAAGDAGACRSCAAAPDLVLKKGRLAELRLHPDPWNAGQLVVTPKRHVAWFSSLREEERMEMGDLASLGEAALGKAVSFEGLNVGYASGPPGHLELHLVPRWHGDSNFMQLVGETNLIPEGLDTTRSRLLDVLGRLGEGRP